MGKASIKVTYSLNPETVMEIETMAKLLGIAKSEVVRRSIHICTARRDELAGRTMTPEEALACLQREPRLTKAEAEAWKQEIAAERSAGYRP